MWGCRVGRSQGKPMAFIATKCISISSKNKRSRTGEFGEKEFTNKDQYNVYLVTIPPLVSRRKYVCVVFSFKDD